MLKHCSIVVIVLILAVRAFGAGADEHTITLTLAPPFGDGGRTGYRCPATLPDGTTTTYWSSIDWQTVTDNYGFYQWPDRFAFEDPLPAGTRLTQIDVAIAGSSLASTEFEVVLNKSLSYCYGTSDWAPGYTLGTFAPSVGPFGTPGQCTRIFQPYAVSKRYDDGAAWSNCGGYVYGGRNTIGIFGNDVNYPDSLEFSSATITLHYVNVFFDFDITDDSPEIDRRVILSNSHSGYDYPRFQARAGRDGVVPMTLRAHTRSGSPLPGLTVYLTPDDPPDPSPYANLPGIDPGNPLGDNFAGFPGLNLTEIRSGTYQAVTDDAGEIHFTISILPWTASGDNYKIKASLDPFFPATITTKYGTLPAWKRVFVEKRRMLRNGIPIAAPAMAGSGSILVSSRSYRGNTGSATISPGDLIILVHSPEIERRNISDGWYVEYHHVAQVHRYRNTGNYEIILGLPHGGSRETLQRPFGPELNGPPLIGDGIALVGSQPISTADTFDAPDTLLAEYYPDGAPKSAFPQAFVEYIVLPDVAVAGSVPLPYVCASAEDILQPLANRWFANVSFTNDSVLAPNHQLLAIADNDGGFTQGNILTSDAGETTFSFQKQTVSFVFRGAIDWYTTAAGVHNGQNPDRWSAKTVAHELTHQWRVDQIWQDTADTTRYHCPPTSLTYNDASAYCLEATKDMSHSETQSDNMIAKFHMQIDPLGFWHSEYFEIRQRPDPYQP